VPGKCPAGFKEPAQRTKEGLCKLKLGFNKSLRVDLTPKKLIDP
jgi:hypothetical protein